MVVIKDNIEKCVAAGVYGCNEGRAGLNVNRLSELLPGDKIIFYATGIGKFAGIFEIVDSIYEDHKQIWKDDIYPYRVKIEPIIYLSKEKWLEVRPLVKDLSYFKNKVQWSMHFMQNLMNVEECDYKLIKEKMEEA